MGRGGPLSRKAGRPELRPPGHPLFGGLVAGGRLGLFARGVGGLVAAARGRIRRRHRLVAGSAGLAALASAGGAASLATAVLSAWLAALLLALAPMPSWSQAARASRAVPATVMVESFMWIPKVAKTHLSRRAEAGKEEGPAPAMAALSLAEAVLRCRSERPRGTWMTFSNQQCALQARPAEARP